jgi:type 1 fimbria pilin
VFEFKLLLFQFAMKKIKLTVITTTLLLSASAQASYVFSCDLAGEIVSEPNNIRAYYNNEKGQEVESETSQFLFKVTKAVPGGRADSDCRTYIGKKIDVRLENVNFSRIKPNAKLRINAFAKDGENTPFHKSFRLLD